MTCCILTSPLVPRSLPTRLPYSALGWTSLPRALGAQKSLQLCKHSLMNYHRAAQSRGREAKGSPAPGASPGAPGAADEAPFPSAPPQEGHLDVQIRVCSPHLSLTVATSRIFAFSPILELSVPHRPGFKRGAKLKSRAGRAPFSRSHRDKQTKRATSKLLGKSTALRSPEMLVFKCLQPKLRCVKLLPLNYSQPTGCSTFSPVTCASDIFSAESVNPLK